MVIYFISQVDLVAAQSALDAHPPYGNDYRTNISLIYLQGNIQAQNYINREIKID